MSKYFNQIHQILESNGEEYEKKYPEIAQKNIFSISTLAHGSASQVYWKLKGQKGQFPYESKVGKAFFLGRVIHEFVQRRMSGFVPEYPLEFSKDNYKLIGHIDDLSFRDSYILEYKTTQLHKFRANPKNQLYCQDCEIHILKHNNRNFETRIKEYILQAGTYAKLISLQTGKEYGASIFVINGTLTEYALTKEDIENSFKVIIQRAEETYQELVKRGEIKN